MTKDQQINTLILLLFMPSSGLDVILHLHAVMHFSSFIMDRVVELQISSAVNRADKSYSSDKSQTVGQQHCFLTFVANEIWLSTF